MPSVVEALFLKGDVAVLEILPPLEAFMSDPARVCALRIFLLGSAERTEKTEFSFTKLQNEWNRLLSLRDSKGDRNTQIKREKNLVLNDHAIRRFVFLENKPHNPNNLAAVLALLSAHHADRSAGTEPQLQRLANSARDAVDFISPILEFLKSGDPTRLSSETTGLELEAKTNKALRQLLEIDSDDQVNISRWFFGERDPRKVASFRDRSYYVLYRYSAEPSQIVKTFLIIDSPTLSGMESFTFTHVYLSQGFDARRISRGALLSFPHAIYFLGSSAPELSGRDPAGRPNIDKPQGLKAVVVPTQEVQNGHRLISAIYLSSGKSWNPIAGRVVLIHVGFESVVGSLTDKSPGITPTILEGPKKLESDLQGIAAIPRSSVSAQEVEELARRTLIRINNRPFCDTGRVDLATEGLTRALYAEDEQSFGPVP